MNLFSYPLVNGIFAVIIALHILVAFLPKVPAVIFNVINILLHAFFILPLAYYGFTTEDGALFYMMSLFVYVAIGFTKYKIQNGGKSSDSGKITDGEPEKSHTDTDISRDVKKGEGGKGAEYDL